MKQGGPFFLRNEVPSSREMIPRLPRSMKLVFEEEKKDRLIKSDLKNIGQSKRLHRIGA